MSAKFRIFEVNGQQMDYKNLKKLSLKTLIDIEHRLTFAKEGQKTKIIDEFVKFMFKRTGNQKNM